MCGRTADEMVDGGPVARVWDPLLEAHPLRIRSSSYPGTPEVSMQEKAAASKALPKRRPEVKQGMKLGPELPESPKDRFARSDSSDGAVAAATSLSSSPGPIVAPQRWQGVRLRESPKFVEAAIRAGRAAEGVMPGSSLQDGGARRQGEASATRKSRHSRTAGKREVAGGQPSSPSAEARGAAPSSTRRSRSRRRDRCTAAVRLRSRDSQRDSKFQ